MPPADSYNPDTGEALNPSPADQISTDEPGGRIVYDPADDQPVMVHGQNDGSVLLLPGSSVPEGMPPPAALVPDEIVGTVV